MKNVGPNKFDHLDIAMNRIVVQLNEKEVLEAGSFNNNKFYELHAMLEKYFIIPKTSVTKIMSRLLFSIGYSKKPLVLVGAGTYTGHALAWLSGYYLLGDATEQTRIYGLDISPEATMTATSNFNRLKAQGVSLIEADAIQWVKDTSEKIDLLYIDIDTKEDGKSKYLDLLNAAFTKMNSGSLIIAHDINEEKFKMDLKPFVQSILEQSKFKSSINLNVDSFGLSISIKR